jgi:Tfp pilus assembly protein PilF
MTMRRRLQALCIRRYLWGISLGLLTLYGCMGAQRQGAPAPSATEHYTRALQYLSIGAAQAAVKELNDALQLDPTNAEFHHLLAFAYHYEGRYQFALNHYTKALELAPGYAEARVHLAGLYLELARWDDAVAQGREALKIATYQHPEIAYNSIGLAYMGKGDLISARRAFRDALAYHDNFPEAHRILERFTSNKDRLTTPFENCARLCDCVRAMLRPCMIWELPTSNVAVRQRRLLSFRR